MTTSLKQLQKRLRYRFKDKTLLASALTHPSARNERDGEGPADNQRLEFLGDAVIGLLAAEELFHAPGEAPEGEMTQLRSGVTSRNALAEVGREWDLGGLLDLGRGEETSGGADRDSNLADAVEAVIGAVFLDGGIKAVHKLFRREFTPRLEPLMESSGLVENPKGDLQELIQGHYQESPTYAIVDEKGPAHDRTYIATVSWQGREHGRGEGLSKRAAQASAAAKALKDLQDLEKTRSSSTESTSS